MVVSKKTIIFQASRVVQHFPGGSNFFQEEGGGPIAYSYRTCDFRGDQDPLPPLGICA